MENPTTGFENSKFLLWCQKDSLGELFRRYTLKVRASSTFVKSRKVQNTPQSTEIAEGIYAKLCIFSRKRETYLEFIFTPHFVIYALIMSLS